MIATLNNIIDNLRFPRTDVVSAGSNPPPPPPPPPPAIREIRIRAVDEANSASLLRLNTEFREIVQGIVPILEENLSTRIANILGKYDTTLSELQASNAKIVAVLRDWESRNASSNAVIGSLVNSSSTAEFELRRNIRDLIDEVRRLRPEIMDTNVSVSATPTSLSGLRDLQQQFESLRATIQNRSVADSQTVASTLTSISTHLRSLEETIQTSGGANVARALEETNASILQQMRDLRNDVNASVTMLANELSNIRREACNKTGDAVLSATNTIENLRSTIVEIIEQSDAVVLNEAIQNGVDAFVRESQTFLSQELLHVVDYVDPDAITRRLQSIFRRNVGDALNIAYREYVVNAVTAAINALSVSVANDIAELLRIRENSVNKESVVELLSSIKDGYGAEATRIANTHPQAVTPNLARELKSVGVNVGTSSDTSTTLSPNEEDAKAIAESLARSVDVMNKLSSVQLSLRDNAVITEADRNALRDVIASQRASDSALNTTTTSHEIRKYLVRTYNEFVSVVFCPLGALESDVPTVIDELWRRRITTPSSDIAAHERITREVIQYLSNVSNTLTNFLETVLDRERLFLRMLQNPDLTFPPVFDFILSLMEIWTNIDIKYKSIIKQYKGDIEEATKKIEETKEYAENTESSLQDCLDRRKEQAMLIVSLREDIDKLTTQLKDCTNELENLKSLSSRDTSSTSKPVKRRQKSSGQNPESKRRTRDRQSRPERNPVVSRTQAMGTDRPLGITQEGDIPNRPQQSRSRSRTPVGSVSDSVDEQSSNVGAPADPAAVRTNDISNI